VHITAEYGAEVNNSTDIVFKNVHIVPRKGSALILKEVENFQSENFTYPRELEKPVELKQGGNSNITIAGVKMR
ncbi:MAG: hypothetical protein ACK5L7_03720, partial [Paludibacteraceae bacterium]